MTEQTPDAWRHRHHSTCIFKGPTDLVCAETCPEARRVHALEADHAAARRLAQAMRLLQRADAELFHGTTETREDWLRDLDALTARRTLAEIEGDIG